MCVCVCVRVCVIVLGSGRRGVLQRRGCDVNMITDVLYSAHLCIPFGVKRFELSHGMDIAL